MVGAMHLSNEEIKGDLLDMTIRCKALADKWIGARDDLGADLTILVNGEEVDPREFATSMLEVLDRMAQHKLELMIPCAIQDFTNALKYGQQQMEEALESAIWDRAVELGESVGVRVSREDCI